MNIRFEKASPFHEKMIFDWLEEPHMKEFWDNSQEHREDIANFIHGRKQHYFCGTTLYWVGFVDDQPFCFILTDQILLSEEELSDLYKAQLSKTGHTISLDFGIGNKAFLGKGLAAPTLIAFMGFYQTNMDPAADTFLIGTDEHNRRAQHVFEKAGFVRVGEYKLDTGAFTGHTHYLMIKTK